MKGKPIPLEFGQIIPISEHLDQYTPQHFSHVEFYSKIEALGCLALHKKIIYAILDLHFIADPDVTENLCLTLPLYTLDDVPAAFLANYEEKELENVNMQSIEVNKIRTLIRAKLSIKDLRLRNQQQILYPVASKSLKLSFLTENDRNNVEYSLQLAVPHLGDGQPINPLFRRQGGTSTGGSNLAGPTPGPAPSSPSSGPTSGSATGPPAGPPAGLPAIGETQSGSLPSPAAASTAESPSSSSWSALLDRHHTKIEMLSLANQEIQTQITSLWSNLQQITHENASSFRRLQQKIEEVEENSRRQNFLDESEHSTYFTQSEERREEYEHDGRQLPTPLTPHPFIIPSRRYSTTDIRRDKMDLCLNSFRLGEHYLLCSPSGMYHQVKVVAISEHGLGVETRDGQFKTIRRAADLRTERGSSLPGSHYRHQTSQQDQPALPVVVQQPQQPTVTDPPSLQDTEPPEHHQDVPGQDHDHLPDPQPVDTSGPDQRSPRRQEDAAQDIPILDNTEETDNTPVIGVTEDPATLPADSSGHTNTISNSDVEPEKEKPKNPRKTSRKHSLSITELKQLCASHELAVSKLISAKLKSLSLEKVLNEFLRLEACIIILKHKVNDGPDLRSRNEYIEMLSKANQWGSDLELLVETLRQKNQWSPLYVETIKNQLYDQLKD